jgi:hypothetical protein
MDVLSEILVVVGVQRLVDARMGKGCHHFDIFYSHIVTSSQCCHNLFPALNKVWVIEQIFKTINIKMLLLK